MLYTYSYNLVISILNLVGSNDEWAFNVRMSHTRFLFYSLTNWCYDTSSLEAMSSERGLCSQILDRPSEILVRPIFFPCFVFCIRSFEFFVAILKCCYIHQHMSLAQHFGGPMNGIRGISAWPVHMTIAEW